MEKRKINKWLILFIIIAILMIGFLFYYMLFYSKKEKQEEVKDDFREIYIYEYNSPNSAFSTYQILTDKSNDTNHKLLYTYKACNTCGIFTISQLNKELIIRDDLGYYLYNFETNKKTKLNIENNYYKKIEFIDNNSKHIALALTSNSTETENKIALYSFIKDNVISEFKYTGTDTTGIDALLENNLIAANITDYDNEIYTIDIINANDGKIYKTLNNTTYLSAFKVGNDIVYAMSSDVGVPAFTLYDKNFNKLTNLTGNEEYAVNTDNTISVMPYNNKTKFYTYDSKGNLKYTSKEYKEVTVVKDYVIVVDKEDNLKLVDKNDNEVTTYLKLTSNYIFHSMLSGWYTENGKNGIYVIVEDSNLEYGNLGSGLEYYYIPSTKETGIIKTEGVGGYAKPVLYLYPEKDTKITLNFEKPYLLTTTYPKYNNNWSVLVKSDGSIYDKDNKYYYALYWEEEGNNKIDFKTGFYVTKEEALTFLEEKTEQIGLNRREANEFIMYWLPILEKNEKSLVYFELTEERESYNKLIISPRPDSLLRVAIHVKKVNEKAEIEEEILPTFNRSGFTAVEWGGTIH